MKVRIIQRENWRYLIEYYSEYLNKRDIHWQSRPSEHLGKCREQAIKLKRWEVTIDWKKVVENIE